MTNTEPWYVTAFKADYREVYPHRDLAAARAEVNWLVEQGLQGRTLDLCCGFGRHSLAMAQAGLDVFGLDLSGELLVQASGLPEGERLAGRLARADARKLPYAADCFDSVANLFSSFGYFGEAGDGEVLDGIVRVLRPGGLLVMDLMNPARIRAGLVPKSEREQGGARLIERRALEDGGRRVTKEVRLEHPDGRVHRWREDVRMYEPAEVLELLQARGVRVTGTYGSFAGALFDPEAERQLVFARAD